MKIRGNGSIVKKDKEGKKWVLTVSLGYDPITRKYRKKTRTVNGNLREARAVLGAFIQEIEMGVADPENVTFGEYAEEWMKQRETSGQIARGSFKRDRSCLKHLNAYLLDTKMTEIEPQVVEDLYAALRDDGVGQNTARKCAIILDQIMKRAVLNGILVRNPCASVKKPPQQDSGEAKSLTKDEISDLLDALDYTVRNARGRTRTKEHARTMAESKAMAVRIALSTGMRRGEILALSWGDVEKGNDGRLVVKVRHSLDTDGTLKDTKTKAGRRNVTLDSTFAGELAKWQQTQKDFLAARGIAQNNATPIVCNENGGFLNCDNFSSWWRSMLKANGMTGIRFHDLRHTHATMLLLKKVEVKTVSSRLGHASVSTTMDIYAHVLKEQDESAADAIGSLLDEVAKPQKAAENEESFSILFPLAS